MKDQQDMPRAVFVTGGTRGIGRAIALRLARVPGVSLALNYLQNDTEAAATKQMVEEQGAACILVKGNIGDLDQVDDVMSTLKQEMGSLDAYVHCAAIGAFKPLVETKPNQWDLTMDVNARGFLYCTQQCLPLMAKGSIVAISSLGGRRVIPNYGAMGPTKAALESLIRYLAAELAPRGIRVNGVSGGFIDTDSMRAFPGFEEMKPELVARTPSGRLGTADDIADIVFFLIGSSARWIVGQVIIADGGVNL